MTSITIAQDETIDLTISQFSESIKKHVIAGDPEKSLYPQLIKVHHLMDLVPVTFFYFRNDSGLLDSAHIQRSFGS